MIYIRLNLDNRVRRYCGKGTKLNKEAQQPGPGVLVPAHLTRYIRRYNLRKETAMQKLFVVIIVLLMLSILPAWAGSKKSSCSSEIKALQEENARLRAELSACQNAKNEAADAQRREAIASLKAIRSALSTGANLQEFKKYQIESRIKVDALHNTPGNQVIKEISNLYRDAVTFGIIRLTGTISSSELEAAHTKYASNKELMKYLSEMKPTYESRGFNHDVNQIAAEPISQILIELADLKFSELK